MSKDIYQECKALDTDFPGLKDVKIDYKGDTQNFQGYGKLNSFYGKKHTEETKAKIRKKVKGVKKHSEEFKKRLSERLKLNNIGGFAEDNGFYGKKHTIESRKKIKEARARQVITEETKKKMSEAHKKRWAKRKDLKSIL